MSLKLDFSQITYGRPGLDVDAALAALLYVASRVLDPTLHKVSKILYFADKKHLEEYGRLIFGDTYLALKSGPVPSGAYELLRAARAGQLEQLSGSGSYGIQALTEPDLEQLSESDLLCLEWAVRQYGSCDSDTLTQLSHDAAWDAADENGEMSVELIASTFANPGPLLEHLRNPQP